MPSPDGVSKGWDSIRIGNKVYVIPVNDTIVHQESDICSCAPTIRELPWGTMIIHHAADLRENSEKDFNPKNEGRPQ